MTQNVEPHADNSIKHKLTEKCDKEEKGENNFNRFFKNANAFRERTECISEGMVDEYES